MRNYATSYEKIVNGFTYTGDMVIGAFLFYWIMAGGSGLPIWTKIPSEDIQTGLALGLCYLICAMRTGLVIYRRKAYVYEMLKRVSINMSIFSLLATFILVAGEELDVYGRKFPIFLLTLGGALCVFRVLTRFLIKWYRLRGGNRREVILVGSKLNMQTLYKELTCQPWAGYRVLGYFDHQPNPEFPEECPYLGTPEEVISYLKGRGVDVLFCSLPSAEEKLIRPMIDYCENNLVHFYSVPNLYNYLQNRVYFNLMGSVPYLELRKDPLSDVGNRLLKRAFDIVFSLCFLCTLFPFILLIVTVVTKMTMPGPVFFRQKRNGLNDKEFYCYKFRSMRVNADADRVQATKDDPRKTKWGNIMRKTNIDELPQFINVLKGDMSVVGPRPHMLKHTEEYSKLINRYMVRHFVKPGITGWSQVTGYRGETRELKEMEGRIRGDIWYLEQWSFSLDLYIIFKTVANAIHGEKNAY